MLYVLQFFFSSNKTSKKYQVTVSKIHGVNFDIRVQTPGKLASAQPIPHDIIPAKKK